MTTSSATYRQVFPRLTDDNHEETSPEDPTYNCIGHAADTRWWWEPLPWSVGGHMYWPAGAPVESNVPAYMAAFRAIGYEPCSDGSFEPGFEKVALFARHGVPKHAAKQITPPYWTSKLGQDVDIKHHLESLEGSIYGDVVAILRRPIGLSIPGSVVTRPLGVTSRSQS